MDQMQKTGRPAARRPGKAGWTLPLCGAAVLVCGTVVWNRFGTEDAAVLLSTLLAAGVQLLSLVLALTSKPRTR